MYMYIIQKFFMHIKPFLCLEYVLYRTSTHNLGTCFTLSLILQSHITDRKKAKKRLDSNFVHKLGAIYIHIGMYLN